MKGGTGRRQNKPVDFSISPAIRNPPALRVPPYYNGSDGSRTDCLLCTDIALRSLVWVRSLAMSVHIRQPVREQPDTRISEKPAASLCGCPWFWECAWEC